MTPKFTQNQNVLYLAGSEWKSGKIFAIKQGETSKGIILWQKYLVTTGKMIQGQPEQVELPAEFIKAV